MTFLRLINDNWSLWKLDSPIRFGTWAEGRCNVTADYVVVDRDEVIHPALESGEYVSHIILDRQDLT